MKKDVFGALALTAILAAGLAGCAPSSAPASGDEASVELRMTWWGGQARADMTNKLLDAFEDSHPGITVAREPQAEDQYAEKLITGAVGGNAPDVVMASSFNMDDFVARGVFADLTSFVDDGTISLSDMNPADVEGGQVDGTQYLVPWGHIVNGVIYDRTVFDNAGISAPEVGWTWDDYAATAEKLASSQGEGAWAMEDEGGTYRGLELFAMQKGKSLFDKDGLGINKDDLTEWFTMWQDFRDRGIVPPPEVQKEQGGKAQEQSMLAQGKVAMFTTSSNQLRSLQAVTEHTLDITSYPWIDGADKQTPIITSAVGITAKSKHPKEAAELIEWMVNDPEAAKIFFAEQGQPPAAAMQEVIAPMLTEPMAKELAFADAMEAVSVPYPALISGSSSVQTLIATENEAIAFGSLSIADAVDDFFAQAEQVLGQ